MWIHWKKKQIRFTWASKRILLTGVTDEPQKCSQISRHKLKGLMKKKVVTHLLVLKATCPLDKPSSETLPVQSLSADAVHQQAPQKVKPNLDDLLVQYQHLFLEPTELPPERSYDHSIPLVPGAHPVNVRPYRYAPQQKDEIERQV
jgi:hypothetical protein